MINKIQKNKLTQYNTPLSENFKYQIPHSFGITFTVKMFEFQPIFLTAYKLP